MLVIEVDGITHLDDAVIARDKKKDHDLTQAGFTVMRFTDEDVLKNINGVWNTIEKWIDEFEASRS